MGYEQAMKEISHNELMKGNEAFLLKCCVQTKYPVDPLYCKMQQELAEKHEAEKEGTED